MRILLQVARKKRGSIILQRPLNLQLIQNRPIRSQSQSPDPGHTPLAAMSPRSSADRKTRPLQLFLMSVVVIVVSLVAMMPWTVKHSVVAKSFVVILLPLLAMMPWTSRRFLVMLLTSVGPLHIVLPCVRSMLVLLFLLLLLMMLVVLLLLLAPPAVRQLSLSRAALLLTLSMVQRRQQPRLQRKLVWLTCLDMVLLCGCP
mmetsp:Transcript_81180/g.169565  ORF Transcript_81180/g.169565 Transcript_81180/m.169565 type:complete len:201 (+) Transcript_81180:358-960(+)